MNDNIVVRRALKTDAAVIADLSRKTFYDTFAKDNAPENMEDFMRNSFSRELLIKEVEEENGVFLLAIINEQPCGYVRLREKNSDNALAEANAIEIARIYVLQESIGEGVGSILFAHCLAIAQELKKDVIWLGVWEKNLRAIAFYKKHGFEKFGEHVFQLGSDLQIDWLMKRTV